MLIQSNTLPAPNNPLAGVRAVLFDLDGTLVESPIDFGRMRAEITRLARGEGLSPAEFAAPDALGMARAAAERLAETSAFLARVEEALVAIELAALPAAREVPGAGELLQSLIDSGYSVGIVTRNCRQAARHMVTAFHLPHGVLLAREDVPRVKPDPGHLLAAARHLGASPLRTLMVGDHPMDVQGGRAAGMRTVGFLGAERPASVFAAHPADTLVRHLREIAAWISPS